MEQESNKEMCTSGFIVVLAVGIKIVRSILGYCCHSQNRLRFTSMTSNYSVTKNSHELSRRKNTFVVLRKLEHLHLLTFK